MRGLRRAYGGMPDDITAGEVVRLVAALFPRSLPVDDVLRRAGIADVAAKRYGRLSGGQKQRVRFAAALVCDPRLLVLDSTWPSARCSRRGTRPPTSRSSRTV